MGWTRHNGTVVSLAVLASVVANYAVHRHFERQLARRPAASQTIAQSPGALIFDAPPLYPDFGEEPDSDIPRCLEDDLEPTRLVGAFQPALLASETREEPAESPSPGAPNPVPVPHDAVPITGTSEPTQPESTSTDAADVLDSHAVRAVIEDELAGSSREERDIWYDELKSLPAGVVRDLLQVRKQLRSLPRALHKMDPDPVEFPRVAELTAEPVVQTRRPTLPDWVPTMNAIEQACTIARHNLANSTTPGYKRLRVMLVDSYGPHWHDSDLPGDDTDEHSLIRRNPLQIDGCRLSDPLLDLTEGPLNQTGRELDLAISGDGFFVAVWKNKPVYTRCGALVLDAQRRICLSVVDAPAPVEPAITIPEDAREIQILADGTVRVLGKPGVEPVAVGQLALARFPSPSRLRPIGRTLLSPTEASGAAILGAPDEAGRGNIQQGFLEQSNVEPELELAEIDQWQSLLKSLPSISRPVTASGQDSSSR
jgi:flagellar basal-body rod protein FlgG